MLYLHMGRGVAIGIVVDGQPLLRQRGFAGEFGHIPLSSTTRSSARVARRAASKPRFRASPSRTRCATWIQKGREHHPQGEIRPAEDHPHIDDIITAAKNDDNLSIELIEEAGEKVGKAVAFLINTFNPETVIVGGNLAAAGDYIMLPLKSATNKYSLNLVYKDTKFRVSKMTENANAWGVAMLIPQQDHRIVMNIEGRTIRLRAGAGDVDLMYEWENDCDIWPVSGTTEPFSRHQLERFVERHQDIVGVLCDGQLRLIIETLLSSKPVGAIDLFRIRPDPPPGRHRHPHLRTERPGTRLRLRRRGNLCRYATIRCARISCGATSVPTTKRACACSAARIHRDRRQTRLAMAAQRLSRRGDAAKDIRLKQRTPSGFGINDVTT